MNPCVLSAPSASPGNNDGVFIFTLHNSSKYLRLCKQKMYKFNQTFL